MAWKTKRIKDFVTLVTEKTTLENKVALENIEEATGKFIETDSEFEGDGVHFVEGDILYGKLRPYLRKVWLAEKEGNAVGDIFVFRHKKNSKPEYLKWLFLSEDFTSKCNGSTQGAKMPRVDSNFILTLSYLLPPESTQQKIANFLDAKTQNIDARIELLEKKKERYTVLRKALINEAVNGEGKNWRKSRLKDELYVAKGNKPEVFEYEQKKTNVPYLSMDFLREKENLNKQYVVMGDAFLVEKDEVLILWDGANAGEIIQVPQKGCISSTMGVFRLKSKSQIKSNKFLFYFLKGKEDVFKYSSNGTTIPHMDGSILLLTTYSIPSLKEQIAIASYLDKKTSAIDSIVSSITKQIDSLKIYRRALINEAVTGKLRIE